MKQKLYRSKEDRFVAGVLGGLAEHYNHDSTFWRLGFIALLLVTGLFPGVILYLVAWVIIPEKPIVEPLGKNEYSVHEQSD